MSPDANAAVKAGLLAPFPLTLKDPAAYSNGTGGNGAVHEEAEELNEEKEAEEEETADAFWPLVFERRTGTAGAATEVVPAARARARLRRGRGRALGGRVRPGPLVGRRAESAAHAASEARDPREARDTAPDEPRRPGRGAARALHKHGHTQAHMHWRNEQRGARKRKVCLAAIDSHP